MRIDVLGDVWHRSKKALTILLRSKATTNWRKEGSGNKIFGENRHAAYDHKGYSQIQSTGREGEGRIWESEARAATPGSPAATTRTAPFPTGSGEFPDARDWRYICLRVAMHSSLTPQSSQPSSCNQRA